MTKDNQIINEASMRSPQLLKLIVYLIIYRNRAVTNTELEQYLWEETESGRQADALKNLVYRLRKLLCDNFGKNEYILTGRGHYQWNTLFELDVDVENFENLYQDYIQNKAKVSRDKAIELYQGIFLKSYEEKYWSNLGIQYQSMYLKMAADLRDELLEKKSYQEIEKVCARVLNTDPYDEEWNKYLVQTLIWQNKVSHAEKYVKGIEKKLKNQSGIQKTNLLRVLKNELSEKGVETVFNFNDFLCDTMLEDKTVKHNSFQVEYNEFKSMVILQSRKDARRNTHSYCILFSIEIEKTNIGGAVEIQDFLMNMAMDELNRLIKVKLRDCDIICKCSVSQYITLLDSCNYEQAIKVAKRIYDLFMEERSSKITNLIVEINRLD